MPGLEGSGEAVGVLRAAGTLKLGFPELGFATALPSPRRCLLHAAGGTLLSLGLQLHTLPILAESDSGFYPYPSGKFRGPGQCEAAGPRGKAGEAPPRWLRHPAAPTPAHTSLGAPCAPAPGCDAAS